VNTETEIAPPVAENLAENILAYAARVRNEATKREFCARFIVSNLDKFVALGVQPSGFNDYIDLDNLTREQVVMAVKLFPGKYIKTTDAAGQMHYNMALDGGVVLRFYNAALPPGCKLVKKTVDVPPQPATTKEVFEVQCGGDHE
jgi:hypothetical protein